jgi:flavin-dependent dehydrogenase
MVSLVASKGPKVDFTNELARIIFEIDEEYGDARMVDGPCFHPLPTIPRRRLHSSRAVVIGDAAGLVSPFSGEGLTSAFMSAELASRVMIEAREETRPQLSHYDSMCNEIILPRLRAAGYLGPLLHCTLNLIGHERLFSNLRADDELMGYCSAFAQGEIGLGRFARKVTPRIPALVLGH